MDHQVADCRICDPLADIGNVVNAGEQQILFFPVEAEYRAGAVEN